MTKGRLPALMGTAEIARRLGVSRSRAHAIATSKGFPDPAVILSAGAIWLAEDVEKWIAEHRPWLNDQASDDES